MLQVCLRWTGRDVQDTLITPKAKLVKKNLIYVLSNKLWRRRIRASSIFFPISFQSDWSNNTDFRRRRSESLRPEREILQHNRSLTDELTGRNDNSLHKTSKAMHKIFILEAKIGRAAAAADVMDHKELKRMWSAPSSQTVERST